MGHCKQIEPLNIFFIISPPHIASFKIRFGSCREIYIYIIYLYFKIIPRAEYGTGTGCVGDLSPLRAGTAGQARCSTEQIQA